MKVYIALRAREQGTGNREQETVIALRAREQGTGNREQEVVKGFSFGMLRKQDLEMS